MANTRPCEATPTRRTHAWFLLLLLIYLIDNADRFMVSAVLPAIKEEYLLSDAQIGLLGSIVYFGLLVLALPAGVLVDKFSRKYMVSIMVTFWSGATLLMGIASSFPIMLLARAGVGLGEAGYNPAAYALIAAWYPKRLRATMIGIFTMGAPLGGALGIALAGFITLHYGWRHVFGIMAAPGFLLAVIFLFAPDYKTRTLNAGQFGQATSSLRGSLQFVFRNRSLRLLTAAQFVIFIYVGAANIWGTVFLMRTFKLNVAQAGGYVAAIALAGALGAFAGGVMADWLTRRSARGNLQSAVISLVFLGVFGGLYYATPIFGLSLPVAVILAGATQFSQASIWASTTAASLDLVPPHYRGKTQSLQPLFMSISAFISPPLVGTISDHWSMSVALEVALGGSVSGCLLLLLFAGTSYRRDLDRQKELGDVMVVSA
ncbi:MFS transporter [Burkholderia sp. Bp9012]|uniref:MFS transporter n=1 Tax=Burkholderia sp. Bp9012 TaxID=2184562 RepID=UPI000F594ED8|nr:MFS transporter [Burkholderia sp. Bp9012]RQR71610.1 MFS transporter [Burkholderia sp. Bp9012]